MYENMVSGSLLNVLNILEQISNAAVLSYQAHFSYMNVWGYEVSFR